MRLILWWGPKEFVDIIYFYVKYIWLHCHEALCYLREMSCIIFFIYWSQKIATKIGYFLGSLRDGCLYNKLNNGKTLSIAIR